MNTAPAAMTITPATHAVSLQRRPEGGRHLARRIEAVANRAHGDDGRIRGLVAGGLREGGLLGSLQLASQIPDVHVHDVRAGVVVVSPDRSQDLPAGKNASLVVHEVDKQLELG